MFNYIMTILFGIEDDFNKVISVRFIFKTYKKF